MSTVKKVESRIEKVEGFRVSILHLDGVDVKGHKKGLPLYNYHKCARHDFTVSKWQEQRLNKAYPGFKVRVWLGDNTEAHGATKLGKVRESYSEE